jgi:hypothetical protein
VLGQDTSADVPLEPGEHAVATVALAAGGAALVVNVRHCYWVDRDREMAARLKHSRPHRLIFELKDHGEVVLDGLGHAVFPLLKFFWFKLGCRESTVG